MARKNNHIEQIDKVNGGRVYSLRVAQGLARKQLAKVIGVTQEWIMNDKIMSGPFGVSLKKESLIKVLLIMMSCLPFFLYPKEVLPKELLMALLKLYLLILAILFLLLKVTKLAIKTFFPKAAEALIALENKAKEMK